MPVQFRKAEKAKSKLRLALIGPSGSGKTYSALAIAAGLAQGGSIAVLDTEHGSASLYADLFGFDVLELDEFSPATYVQAIHAAEAAGYAVIVVDSLSHAWEGTGGALDMADKATKRSDSKNSYMAWRDVTPHHNALVEAMVGSKAHLIATMRVKTEYVIEDQNGKKVPRRVGLAPIQRAGMDYEFTVVGDMNRENELIVSKTRIPLLNGVIVPKPGADLAQTMLTWLDAGAEEHPKVTPSSNGSSPATPEPTPSSSPASNGHGPESLADEQARKRFWVEAKALGYITPEGGLSKAAVHRFFGVPERDGALAEWRESEGKSWESLTNELRARTQVPA